MTFDLMEIQFPYLVEQEICAKEIEIDEEKIIEFIRAYQDRAPLSTLRGN